MEQEMPATDLRLRLVEQLTNAVRALTDGRTTYQDSLAITRNVAAAVLTEVDILADSPAMPITIPA